jgi:DNA-binding PadR family transcriptional regulator
MKYVAKPQMTMATLKVLRELSKDSSKGHYGLELCRATNLPSGTIYPILRRLEREGWIESDWEKINPSEAGRPRRRLYKIDPSWLEQIRYELATAHQTFAQVPWAPRPQGELA